MKVAIIIGTKAELIKIVPLMKEFNKRKIDYTFIHSGQHDLGSLPKYFKVKGPDIVLYKPPKLSSRFMTKIHKAIFWGISLLFKIRKTLNKLNPDFVFYHGDTLTTTVAAMASSSLMGSKKWKCCHIEAGLRSNNLFEPFPEEISRRIADYFSDILFAPSKLSLKNIKYKSNVYNVGNTVVDGVKEIIKKRIKKSGKEYVIVNVHRHENITSKQRIEKIYQMLKEVNYPIVWPIHDNTKKQIMNFGLWGKLNVLDIKFTKLVSYFEFVGMLKNCKYIISDGGSIQEESLILKKPCIILRNNTERQEGLKTGINFLTKFDINYTKKVIDDIESGKIKVKKFTNPYGDGKTSKKIVDIICKFQ